MKIAIIRHKGFLGSRLMKAIPETVGIGRGELDKLNDTWDWVINCAMTYKGTDEQIVTDNILPFIKAYQSGAQVIQFGSIMEEVEQDTYTICKTMIGAMDDSRLCHFVLGDVYDQEDTSRGNFIDRVLTDKNMKICDSKNEKVLENCHVVYPHDVNDIISGVLTAVMNDTKHGPLHRAFMFGKVFIENNSDNKCRGHKWGDKYNCSHEASLRFLISKKEKKNEF